MTDADRDAREQDTKEIAHRILTSSEGHHGDARVLAHRALTLLDQLQAERQARAALEQALRQEYWLNHRCDEFAALYGDDGEMQCCGSPHRPMDFKRLPFEELQETVHSLRLARVGRALLRGAGEQPALASLGPCVKCGLAEDQHGTFGFRDHEYLPAPSGAGEQP